MTTDNGVPFPGKDNSPVLPIPPLHDVLQGGSKVCPFMAPTVAPMPIVTQSKLATPNQAPQMVMVRHYHPCLGPGCAAWVRHEHNDPKPGEGHCALIHK